MFLSRGSVTQLAAGTEPRIRITFLLMSRSMPVVTSPCLDACRHESTSHSRKTFTSGCCHTASHAYVQARIPEGDPTVTSQVSGDGAFRHIFSYAFKGRARVVTFRTFRLKWSKHRSRPFSSARVACSLTLPPFSFSETFQTHPTCFSSLSVVVLVCLSLSLFFSLAY